jgi:hypothetical protein
MDKHNIVIVILMILLVSSIGFSFLASNSESPTLNTDYQAVQEEKVKLLQEKQQLEQQLIDLKEASASTGSSEQEIAQLRKELEKAKANQQVLEVEKDSPFDHVKDSQIRVLKNKVELNVNDVFWWTIEDTNSMDPLIDAGSTALSVKPKDEKGIRNGDVAFYKSQIIDSVIVHRVIEVNNDQKGWYSRFKGDNLIDPDPEFVRFPQVEGVLIGVIY